MRKQILLFLISTLLYVSNNINAVQDTACSSQTNSIDEKIKQNLISKYLFNNDSKNSFQLVWVGENTGILLIATVEEVSTFVSVMIRPSTIYKSIDNGKTFTNITSLFSPQYIVIRKSDGMQRHPNDKNVVYISTMSITGEYKLFISTDLTETWKSVDVSFAFNEKMKAHPSNDNYLLFLDSFLNKLYISTNKGLEWKEIRSTCSNAGWLGTQKEPVIYSIYFPMENDKGSFFGAFRSIFDYRAKQHDILLISNDLGKTWTIGLSDVIAVIAKGRYIYVSVGVESKGITKRRLLVSSNNAVSWSHVQLPQVTQDQFYVVLSIDNDFVFIHVADQEAGGQGTLYTSDSSGIIFSESLKNHLYVRNLQSSTDFFKVSSMPGTYIASVVGSDLSVSSVITFNRGATWKQIKKPDSVSTCDKCNLHVNGDYAVSQDVTTFPPLATPTAVGIIMAHGHVGESQRRSNPDVYVSSDGGYNWYKSLSGPHYYQIADHGGLLVAMDASTSTPTEIKFSTDVGRCWHVVNFTSSEYRTEGILTEPGSKSMTVALWGFDMKNNIWSVHVVDFSKYIDKQCDTSDYEEWIPHNSLIDSSSNPASNGCLLGEKRTVKRLKQDSLCRNGYSHIVESTVTPCTCTQEDYECEFGYTRPANSMTCVLNPFIEKLDMCVNGNVERIVTDGYRRIPGDKCVGGFTPDKTKQVFLNKKCDLGSNLFGLIISKATREALKEKSRKKKTKVFVVLGISVLVIVVGALGYLVVYQYRRIRQAVGSGLHYSVLHVRPDDDAPLLLAEPSEDRDVHLLGASRVTGSYGGTQSASAHNNAFDSDDPLFNLAP